MHLIKRGWIAAALVVALVLAACGSDSSTTDLSKQDFLKQGNAICSKGEVEVEAGVEKFARENNISEAKPPSEKQMEEIAEDFLVPSVRDQLTELRALGIPSGDDEQVEAIFAAVEKALKETEEDPAVFAEGGAGPFKEANQLARDYGLTACGSEPEEESSNSGAEK